jgi:hypothetical protein
MASAESWESSGYFLQKTRGSIRYSGHSDTVLSELIFLVMAGRAKGARKPAASEAVLLGPGDPSARLKHGSGNG